MSATWCPAARLVEVVGEGAALVLLKTYGGTARYIRKRTPHPDMVALIGAGPAAALSEHFGGTDVLFPSCEVRPATAKGKLVPLLEGGASAAEAAKVAGCSVRFASEVKRDLGLSKPKRKAKVGVQIIRDMIRAGRKDIEIARACGVTAKHVWRVRLAIQREARA
jgi:hypothetical protein